MKTRLISTATPEPAKSRASPAEGPDFLAALAHFDAHANADDWQALLMALNGGGDAGEAFTRRVQGWAQRQSEASDDHKP